MLTLEQKLQGKLDLSRRAKIPSREACRLNFPKRPAGGRENRVAEIRMVEDVEHLAPELEIEFLRDLCIFCDREIGVHEIGAGNGITAQVTRMACPSNAGRNEDGLVREPLRRIAGCRDGSGHAGSDG